MGAVGGLAGIAGGIIGGGKRRAEQRAAQTEMQRAKNRMMNLDTSNLAANMENTYEDLTVNTQAADFQAQQNQAMQANIMSQMGGAAGGSGIAALAQTMANQGAQQAQAASASISQQEQTNAMMAAKGGMAVQSAQVAGAQEGRGLEYQKTNAMLGMGQQRLSAANAARQAATQSIMSGVGSLAAGAATEMDAIDKAGDSDRRLKKNIKLIGYSPSGLKIYAFEYINNKLGKGIYQGVMSDEIPEYAVIKHQDGYDKVDYSKLDVEFKIIQ